MLRDDLLHPLWGVPKQHELAAIVGTAIVYFSVCLNTKL